MGDPEAHCREVLEQLFLYVDGEMGEGDRAVLRRHIEACADCLGHVDLEIEWKRIVQAKCGDTEPPVVLVERVRAFLLSVRRG